MILSGVFADTGVGLEKLHGECWCDISDCWIFGFDYIRLLRSFPGK